MLVSYEWLKEFVNLDLPPGEVERALTMSGTEVEGYTLYGNHVTGTVAGEILEIGPHPGADRLSVLTIDVGGRSVTIIAGIPGLRVGLKVGVAMGGATLWDIPLIENAKIRGVVSEGKLCSEADVGVSGEAEKLLVFEEDVEPGTDIHSNLRLGDPVFNVTLTPNRGDCLSVMGLAREMGAVFGVPMRIPKFELKEIDDPIDRHARVSIGDTDGCGRYAARIIRGVTIGESPLWMKIRLKKAGMRPINNIVDVTNYVMIEMGQPLHAFDLDRLPKKSIMVRDSLPQERFVTLDGEERVLPEGTVMITDDDYPVAIGGIMGGENSEVVDDTSAILLECAYFDPDRIFDSSRKLDAVSEASIRFAHGVDPGNVPMLVDRTSALMAELSGGEVLQGRIDRYPREIGQARVTLRLSWVNHVLGSSIETGKMKDILTSLGFGFSSSGTGKDEVLQVIPPSFRRDIGIEEDLIEEIGRVYGYDNIEPTLPPINREVVERNSKDEFKRTLRSTLKGMGFSEVVTSSFLGKKELAALGLTDEAERVRIMNPQAEEEGILRASLIPHLLKAAAWNLNRRNSDLKLFEYGKVYVSDSTHRRYTEPEILGAVFVGSRFDSAWELSHLKIDFFDIKGIVKNLFRSLSVHGLILTGGCSFPWVEGQSGRILSSESRELGYFGKFSEDLLDRFEIREPVFGMELFPLEILPLIRRTTRYKPYSRFPGTERDASLVVPMEISCEHIRKIIYDVNKDIIKEVEFLDFYKGKQIPGDRKGMTFRISFQAEDRTLRDEEIDEVFTDVIEKLAHSLGVVLRDN